MLINLIQCGLVCLHCCYVCRIKTDHNLAGSCSTIRTLITWILLKMYSRRVWVSLLSGLFASQQSEQQSKLPTHYSLPTTKKTHWVFNSANIFLSFQSHLKTGTQAYFWGIMLERDLGFNLTIPETVLNLTPLSNSQRAQTCKTVYANTSATPLFPVQKFLTSTHSHTVCMYVCMYVSILSTGCVFLSVYSETCACRGEMCYPKQLPGVC